MKTLICNSLFIFFVMLGSNAQPISSQDLNRIHLDFQKSAGIDCNDPSTWPSGKEAKEKVEKDCHKRFNLYKKANGPKIGDACNCIPKDFIRKYIFTKEEFNKFELYDKEGKLVQGVITKINRGKVLIKLHKISNLENLTMRITTKLDDGNLSTIEMPVPLKSNRR